MNRNNSGNNSRGETRSSSASASINMQNQNQQTRRNNPSETRQHNQGSNGRSTQGVINLDDYIANYVRNIIRQRSYLEVSSMITQLTEFGFAERHLYINDKVKHMLRMNKDINLMIDVYERTNSIMVYCEMKEFIVKQMKAYLKSMTINCFEDLAVGFLFAHPKVYAMFRFPDGSNESDYTSNPVSKEMIFKIAKEFLDDNGKVDVKNDATQVMFQTFMRSKLRIEYGIQKSEGVVVVFKDIFHHLIKLKSLENRELLKVREASEKAFHERAKASVNIMLGTFQLTKAKDRLKIVTDEMLLGKMQSKFQESQEFIRGLLARSIEDGLKMELLAMLSGMSYDCCVLRHKKKHAIVVQVQPGDPKPEDLWIGIHAVDKLRNVECCLSAPPQRTLQLLLVNFVALMCWMVLDNTDEPWGYVEASVNSVSLDMKLFLRSCLQDLMQKVLPRPSIYVDENGKNIKSTVSFAGCVEKLKDVLLESVTGVVVPTTFQEIMSDLRETTVQEAAKSYKDAEPHAVECISARNYVALMTGGVIMHHITSTKNIVETTVQKKVDELKKVVPVLVKSVVQHAEWLRDDLKSKSKDATPTSVVTRLLQELHHPLLMSTNIPSFEAIRMDYLTAVKELKIQDCIESALTETYPEWNMTATAEVNTKETNEAVLTTSEVCALLDQAYESLTDQHQNVLTPAELMLNMERSLLSQCGVESFEQITGGKSFLSFIESAGCEEDIPSRALTFIQTLVERGVGHVQAGELVDANAVMIDTVGPMVPQVLPVPNVVLESLLKQVYKQLCTTEKMSSLELMTIGLEAVMRHFAITHSELLERTVSEIFDQLNQGKTALDSDAGALWFVEDSQKSMPNVSISQAIGALLEVPLGCDCISYTHWIDCFAGAVDCVSVAEFILKHEMEFKERRSDVVYLCVDGGKNCIPIPKAEPTRAMVQAAVQEVNIPLLAALVCGAVACHHHTAATMCAQLLFQNDDFSESLTLCIKIVDCLPASLGIVKGVLLLMSEVVSQKQHVTVQTALKMISGHAVERNDSLFIAKVNALSRVYPSDFETVHFQARLPVKAPVVETLSIATVHESQPTAVVKVMSDSTETSTQIDLTFSEIGSEKKQLIEQFLRTDFGYDEEGRRPAKDDPQSINLQKALDLLSASLYTSDVHFIMELLQNADDNLYAEGVKPALKFDLHRDALYLYNNELGFQLPDIYSICKVGGSTKTVRAGVHIGQKGIGFKSVFSISDCPEVHSNGFHIRFDKKQSMLEPIWISENQHYQWPKQMQTFGDETEPTHFETCLRLQFDSNTRKTFDVQKMKLQEVLDEKLLLFLNKIEILEMVDHSSFTVKASRSSLSKRHLCRNWVYVTQQKFDTSFSDSYWLVKRHSFEPQSRRNDQKVRRTEVALAFMFNGSLLDLDNTQSGKAGDDRDPLQCRELTLDRAETMMKMYAFLPTSYGYFRFIVQGDFVLATNRESISDNTWNHELLDQVPQMVVEMLLEFAMWAWKSSKGASASDLSDCCPNLCQLLTSNYKVKITMQDVFHLLPRLSTVRMEEKKIIDVIGSIYKKLRDTAFLISQSGELFRGCDLLYVDHLPFKVSKYIKDDELQLLLGKKFIHSDVEYDAELFKLLGIEVFSEAHILICVKQFAASLDSTSDGIQNDNRTMPSHSENIKILSRLLMLLSKITSDDGPQWSATDAATVAAASQKSHLQPSQVTVNRLKLRGSASKPANNSTYSEIFRTLRSLKIWPVVVGTEAKFVSLDGNTVLVYSAYSLREQQLCCVEVFKHHLLLLDDALLKEATSVDSKTNLQSFLVQKFGSNYGSGGIENLNVDVVIRSFIINAYEAASVAGGPWNYDRQETAAMLALLFISSVMKNCNSVSDSTFRVNLRAFNMMMKEASIFVPTLSVRNKDKHKVVWSASTMQPLRNTMGENTVPDVEVHLGIECSQSATSQFTTMAMSTALRQMNWTIVDPLVFSYVLGLHEHPSLQMSGASVDPSAGFVPHESASSAFATANGNVVTMWQEFLLNIGVVDFFGIYKQDSQLTAPLLSKFLSHYLAPAKPAVNLIPGIRGNSWNIKKKAEEAPIDDDLNEKDVADTIDLVIYVPRVDTDEVDAPLLVRLNTHAILQCVANLILAELTKKGLEKSSLAHELSRKAWMPVELSTPTVTLPSGYALVAAPMSVFYCTKPSERNDSRPTEWYPMGQHVMYKAQSVVYIMQTNPLEMKVGAHGQWSSDELMKLFLWMTEQTPGTDFYNNLPWMHEVYTIMYKTYFNSALISSDISKQLLEAVQEKPFIWFPNVVDEASLLDENVKVGRLYQLREVFEKDPTTTSIFLNSGCPHRSLNNSYDMMTKQEQLRLSSLFARQRCCVVCQAVEGMFGVRGQSVGSSYGNQKCSCRPAPIETLTSSQTLISKSPSLYHTVNLVAHYRDEYLKQLKNQIASEESSKSLEVVMLTLENISREIWKCFYIDNCLHAYSAQSLAELKKRCQTEKLLPSVDNKSFFCLSKVFESDDESDESGDEESFEESNDDEISPLITIAVDDYEIFERFQSKLVKLSDTQWVDGRVNQVDFFPVIKDYTSICSASFYDVDGYREKCQAFLNDPNFSQLASTIPPMTFYAPLNLLALYGFLGIERLSKHVTTEWLIEKASESDIQIGSSVLELINNLLLIVQVVLHSKAAEIIGYDPARFLSSERMKTLLSVEVVDCSSLVRSVVLNLNGMTEAADITQDYHYNQTENKLLVSQSISKANKIKLCTDFVLSAVRVELSLINMNQNLDILAKCKELCTKLADKRRDQILNYFSCENFAVPGESERWVIVKEVEAHETNNADSSDEEADEIAMKALDNLKNLTRNKPVVPRNTQPRVTELDKGMVAYLAEKELRDKQGVQVPTMEHSKDTDTPSVIISEAVENRQTLRPRIADDGSVAGSVASRRLVSDSDSLAGSTRTSNSVVPHVSATIGGPPAQPLEEQSEGEVDRRYENGFNQSEPGLNESASSAVPIPPLSEAYAQQLRLDAAVNGPIGHIVDSAAPIHHSVGPPNPLLGSFIRPSHFNHSTMKVELSDLILNDFSSVTQIPDSLIRESLQSGNGNAVTGRLGEMIAFKYLQEKLQTLAKSIIWMNEIVEQLLPYDIQIVLNDGRVKRCEVKARMASGSVNQWHFSASEVRCIQQDEDYFAVLFAIEVSSDLQNIKIHTCIEVGFEGGLRSEIESGRAGFIVQINSDV